MKVVVCQSVILASNFFQQSRTLSNSNPKAKHNVSIASVSFTLIPRSGLTIL